MLSQVWSVWRKMIDMLDTGKARRDFIASQVDDFMRHEIN